MDLLDRLLGHDAWTTRQLLERCRELTDEQLDRELDIGHRTARATLLHILRNMEVWAELMSGRAARAKNVQMEDGSVAAMIVRLDDAAADLARVSRSVAVRGEWNGRFLDTLDDPPTEHSFGGGIAHVITHSMHHRAQLLYMLRRLGLEGLPEGDVLSWERQLE